MTLDSQMMERALVLANKARITSPPNPWVGCVIVKEGRIIGEGFTQEPGGAHAEVVALKQAKNHTQGATAYVTLEPCSHFGRTPPCVNALIEAGISRLVIGIKDPDLNVQGKGIAKLRAANIDITLGVLEKPISESLAPYLHHRKTGRPYCILKGAISVDGRIAAEDGTSQWISSEEARLDYHHVRAESQAIIIGAGTACVDLPALTVRNVLQYPSTPPLRVILDAKGRVTPRGPLFDTSLAPTLIITTPDCPQKIKEEWKNYGVQIEVLPLAKSGIGVNLEEVLILLGKREILQVIVEGGGKILGSFLEARIANQLNLYVGGLILGSGGVPLFETDFIKTIKESPQLILTNTKILGNSVRLDYLLNEKTF